MYSEAMGRYRALQYSRSWRPRRKPACGRSVPAGQFPVARLRIGVPVAMRVLDASLAALVLEAAQLIDVEAVWSNEYV